jgi:hypothetical protein
LESQTAKQMQTLKEMPTPKETQKAGQMQAPEGNENSRKEMRAAS